GAPRGEQPIPSADVAGVRQDERPDQHKHQNGHNQRSGTRLYFACDTAFGSFDVVSEGVEFAPLRLVLAHRVQPCDSGAAAGCPTPGMPRPTPDGRCPAASPARVRRWLMTSPSAIRGCGAAPVIV